jgi:hypothetical protein
MEFAGVRGKSVCTKRISKVSLERGTCSEHRSRSTPWPLLLALAMVVLTPVVLIGPTLVSPRSAINTVIGGKRLFMGRIHARWLPPGVYAGRLSDGGYNWQISAGASEQYLIFFSESSVDLGYGADGTAYFLYTSPDANADHP